MTTARTGRRTAAEEQGLLQKLREKPLPDVGKSPASIQNFLRAVIAGVGSGLIDRGTGETLAKLARGQLAAWNAEQEQLNKEDGTIVRWIGTRFLRGLGLGDFVDEVFFPGSSGAVPEYARDVVHRVKSGQLTRLAGQVLFEVVRDDLEVCGEATPEALDALRAAGAEIVALVDAAPPQRRKKAAR